MSLPEISRRCLACGAAVRAGARFCPQCGTGFEAEAPAEGPRAPAPRARETSAPGPAPVAPPAPTQTPAAPTPMPVPEAAPAREAGADGSGAGRTGRAAARVRETVLPRVEKMRDEALVALEETPDDSGLRFVVIALVLFGLFLLLLILSTTVLR